MNNKPIDLKTVLFTLEQLQHTVDVLTGKTAPATLANRSTQSSFHEESKPLQWTNPGQTVM